MRRTFSLKSLLVVAALVAAICGVNGLRRSGGHVLAQSGVTQGALQAVDPNGKPKALCPLKHTEVKAQISGFISRVVVTQEFENPFKEKIEAVYTFPLPQNAAVDDMTMLASGPCAERFCAASCVTRRGRPRHERRRAVPRRSLRPLGGCGGRPKRHRAVPRRSLVPTSLEHSEK